MSELNLIIENNVFKKIFLKTCLSKSLLKPSSSDLVFMSDIFLNIYNEELIVKNFKKFKKFNYIVYKKEEDTDSNLLFIIDDKYYFCNLRDKLIIIKEKLKLEKLELEKLKLEKLELEKLELEENNQKIKKIDEMLLETSNNDFFNKIISYNENYIIDDNNELISISTFLGTDVDLLFIIFIFKFKRFDIKKVYNYIFYKIYKEGNNIILKNFDRIKDYTVYNIFLVLYMEYKNLMNKYNTKKYSDFLLDKKAQSLSSTISKYSAHGGSVKFTLIKPEEEKDNLKNKLILFFTKTLTKSDFLKIVNDAKELIFNLKAVKTKKDNKIDDDTQENMRLNLYKFVNKCNSNNIYFIIFVIINLYTELIEKQYITNPLVQDFTNNIKDVGIHIFIDLINKYIFNYYYQNIKIDGEFFLETFEKIGQFFRIPKLVLNDNIYPYLESDLVHLATKMHKYQKFLYIYTEDYVQRESIRDVLSGGSVINKIYRYLQKNWKQFLESSFISAATPIARSSLTYAANLVKNSPVINAMNELVDPVISNSNVIEKVDKFFEMFQLYFLYKPSTKNYNKTILDIVKGDFIFASGVVKKNNLNTFSDNNFKLILILNNLVTCLLDKDKLEDINNFWDKKSNVNFKYSKILGESYDTFQIEINGDKTIICFKNLFPLTTCIKEICERIDLTDESVQRNILISYTESTKLIHFFITLWGWYFREKNFVSLNTDKNFNNFLAKLKEKETEYDVDRNFLLLKYDVNHLREYYFLDSPVALKKTDEIQLYFYFTTLNIKSYVLYNGTDNIISVDKEKYELESDENFSGECVLEKIFSEKKIEYYLDTSFDEEINKLVKIVPNISFVTNKKKINYYYCLMHGVVFYNNNVKDLKSGNEYKLLNKDSENNILKIFLRYSKNIFLVKNIKTNDISFMVVMINKTKYITSYWKDNNDSIYIRNNKIHFIQINSNYFTFKFPSIDDFHALFISFIFTENIHALYLLKNRITSDVTKISLHPNKEKYLYYDIINSLSKKMNIPFAHDFEIEKGIFTNILEASISQTIDINPIPIQNKSYFQNNTQYQRINIESLTIVKILKKIEEISEYITRNKKNLNKEVFNENLQQFLDKFRSVCENYSFNTDSDLKLDSESDLDSESESESESESDYINIIFNDILNLYTFHNIKSLYLKNTDLLYQRLIIEKYNRIVNELSLEENFNESCGEVLRIISDLDPLVIYNFDEPRSQSQIQFELHNGIFIRQEQIDIIKSFFSNSDLTNTAYEILMGKGKTSTITPEYVLEHYEINKSFNYVIVLPSHLVLSSYDIFSKIIDLFDGYCLRIYPQVDIKQRLKITDTGFPTITIVSDATLKHYVLDIINKEEKTINNIFNGLKNVFIFDEIDTLVNPLNSYLNIGGEKIHHKNIEKLVQVLYQLAINIYFKKDYLYSIESNNSSFEKHLLLTIENIYSTVKSYKYKKDYGFVSYQLDINNNTNTAFYKTVPYSAINSPVDDSEFSDFEISILLTFLSYFNCTEIRFKDCNNIYKIFKKIYNTVENIIKSLFIEKIIDFFNLFEKYIDFIKIIFNLIKNEETTPENVHETINNYINTTNNIKFKITLIYFYIIYFVQDKCFKYPEDKYNISTIDLLDTNVTPNKICFSGTVNFNLFDKDTVNKLELKLKDFNLEQNINEQLNRIKPDNIAQGEIESAIRSITTIADRKIKLKNLNLFEYEIENEIIKYLIENINSYNALIDVGGYILKTKPRDLMEMIWSKINRDRKLLYINEDNVKTIYMGPYQLGQKYSNEIYKDCFIFYDNKNCVGTDFKQPYKMHGLITIGKSNNLTEVAQGVYRLRNINIGHTVDYITPETFLKKKNGIVGDKYNLIYDNLFQADQNNKVNLERNALIQFAKFIKRKHLKYDKKYYQEQNYIATVPYKSKSWLDLTFKSEQYITEETFLEQELVSTDFNFETRSIKKKSNISQPEILLNIDINIDINIDESIDINKHIDYTVSINNLLLYNGNKQTFVGCDGFFEYLLSPTTFEFTGIVNQIYKQIEIFNYELIISQDVLSHIELEKDATKNKKQYFQMFFKNLFILQIFTDTRSIIRIISFYEYILFKQFINCITNFKYILYSSTGLVERNNIGIDIVRLNMYKELAFILFGKIYEIDVNKCIIARYFIINNFKYKKELLDILQSILKVKYLFNYQSINSLQFKNNIDNKYYWEKIIKNSSVNKVLESDFSKKYKVWIDTVKKEIKEIKNTD